MTLKILKIKGLDNCQVCHVNKGRFLLHCYCLYCADCHRSVGPDCLLCTIPVEGKVRDFRTERGRQIAQALFSDSESLINSYVTSMNHKIKLCQKLEEQNRQTTETLNELINMHPYLEEYFVTRIPGFEVVWDNKLIPRSRQINHEQLYQGPNTGAQRSMEKDMYPYIPKKNSKQDRNPHHRREAGSKDQNGRAHQQSRMAYHNRISSKDHHQRQDRLSADQRDSNNHYSREKNREYRPQYREDKQRGRGQGRREKQPRNEEYWN